MFEEQKLTCDIVAKDSWSDDWAEGTEHALQILLGHTFG